MASPKMKSWLMLLAVGVNLLKRLLIPAYHVPESQPAQALKYVDQLAVAQIIHQKPKRKDWHPPDGFILGLWMLILLVFFKSYGLKQLKHIF